LAKLNEDQKSEIVKRIEGGTPYSVLAKEFGVSKQAVSKLFLKTYKKPKSEENLNEVEKKKQKKRKELSIASQYTSIINHSDVIIGDQILSMQSLILGHTKLLDIVVNSEKRIEEMKEKLDEIYGDVMTKVIEGDDKKNSMKQDLILRIQKVLGLLGSYHSTQDIIIRAVKELHSQAITNVEWLEKFNSFKNTKELVDAFLTSTNDLPNAETYFRYRDSIISKYPPAKGLFAKFEQQVDRCIDSNQQNQQSV
jgi:hypothetical protein